MNTLGILALLAAPLPVQEAAGYVDTHMHLTSTGRGPRARRNPDFTASINELLSMMDRAGVDRVILLPPPQVPGQGLDLDYEDLAPIVRAHPDRLAFVAGGGTLNPMIQGTASSEVTADVRSRFEAAAEAILAAGAKGFGEMTALHFSHREGHPFEEVPPDHPLFLLLADIAARNDVPIDLHMDAVEEDMDTPDALRRSSDANPARIRANVAALERLLDHNPEARIVLQHVGSDPLRNITAELLRRLLGAHPNLHFALRIPTRGSNWITGPGGEVLPEWAALFRDFPDRAMIGSDEFVSPPGQQRIGPPGFEGGWALVRSLPEELARRIGSENARRVYRL